MFELGPFLIGAAIPVVVLLLILALAGCTPTPPVSESTEGNGYQVAELFTKDGCTVYRFHDGNYVYFTSCTGSTQSEYTTSHQCGKVQCSERHDVYNDTVRTP
jgi:hypothetical protein